MLGLPLAMGCSSESPAASEDAAPAGAPQSAGAPSSATDSRTEQYVSGKGRSLALDIYKPTGAPKHRAVILIHGGGWVSGNRLAMADIARVFAKAGYAAVSIDYTLAPQGIWPTQLEDVQAAVRYVRTHAKDLDVDPKWVAASGISAGGHLSMLLGTLDTPKDGVSSKVQAVGSISGIHDLNQPMTPDGERYHIVQALMGESGTPDVEARKQASPDTFVKKDSAPVYFIQGDADPLVPRAQSDQAASILKKAGVESKLVMVPGMGHGLSPNIEAQKKALDDLIDWMNKH